MNKQDLSKEIANLFDEAQKLRGPKLVFRYSEEKPDDELWERISRYGFQIKDKP